LGVYGNDEVGGHLGATLKCAPGSSCLVLNTLVHRRDSLTSRSATWGTAKRAAKKLRQINTANL